MSEPVPPHQADDFDEVAARATLSPGTPALDEEEAADLPFSWLGTPGRAPVAPAGPRGVRRPAATAGQEPRSRHNWMPIGPRNVAGRMRAIVSGEAAAVADPQIWFAASAGGGVWRTRDGGRRWEPLPDWNDKRCLVIGALAVAPSNPARVYAATGEAAPAGPNTLRGFGVFVSTNGGDTWDNHGGGAANPVHRGGFEAVAVDPGNELHAWAVGVDGAFRTLDGGVTWDPPYAAGTYFSDAAFTGSGRLLLVRGTSRAGEGAVLRIDSPAAATAAVTAAFASADSVSVVIAARPDTAAWPTNGRIAVATAATAFVRFADEDDRHAGIFRTTSLDAALGRSVTWTRLPDHEDFHTDGQGGYNMVLGVPAGRPDLLVAGAVHLHVSPNANAPAGSVRWRRIMAWELNDEGLRGHHADQHGLAIAGAPPQLWVANDGGVARATPNWTDTAATAPETDLGRPLKPGSVSFTRRDAGIQGAQTYDLAQSPLVPGVVAVGMQDNGTYLRSGGGTWRPMFGGDGAFCTFDPDDPYRLYISYYGGLVALQFPALRDRIFDDDAADLADTATDRLVVDGLDDGSVFVPETARDPLDSGRVLHTRVGRLYGLRTASGERFAVEPVGRSFVLRVRMPLTTGGPTARLPRPLRPGPPPPPEPRLPVEVADTPGAHKLGLIPGRGGQYEHVDVTDRDRFVLASRLPGPYRLAEGDELRVLVGGAPRVATFGAADGIDLAAVTVADVARIVTAKLADPRAEAVPSFWRASSAVQLVTRDAGPAAVLRLDGDALDPLPDGLSRLSINRGAYHGDTGRPASLLLNVGPRTSKDFSGAVRTLRVGVNGGPLRSLRIEPPTFPDPANITAGQLADGLATLLAADPVQVHAVPSSAWVSLLSDAGARVVLGGTAAARMALPAAGAPLVRLGPKTRTATHRRLHVRNFSGLDLSSGGPPLQLVISDGTTATPPLTFTGAGVADLRAVTAEELHSLVSTHLAATPAVRVRADLVVAPAEGWVSELRFGAPPPRSGGGPAAPAPAWAGGQDGSLFLTLDGGATWLDRGNPRMRLGDREVEAIATHPTDPATVWVALSGEATVPADVPFVFRTIDAGLTWQVVGQPGSGGIPLGVHALETDPDDPRTVFAATDAGVFRSLDAGDTWAPFNEGLPNAQVVDLTIQPEERMLRAALWTRGVYQRRIDAAPPDDVRLLIRATQLDDGVRPARSAPSFGTAAAGPVPPGSPDIKVVRARPAGIGTDADVDGVTFDLDIPHEDIVAGAAADVMVQVTNAGPIPAPPPPGAIADRIRVVLLWAPADTGPPALPPDIWTRLAGPPPLAGALGGWTVVGDAPVPRTVPGGDTGIVTFPMMWPALDGIRSVVLLALATAPADPLTGGPTDVAVLVAAERRAAVREVPVRRLDDDRTLVVRSTGRDPIVVENVVPPEGNGAGAQLGLAGVLGGAGVIRQGTAAATDDRDLAAAGAAPALGVRLAAARTADLTLLPAADEARTATAVHPAEIARMLMRRITSAGLPIGVRQPAAGFVLTGTGGALLRATGPAATRLGLPVGGPGAPVLATAPGTNLFALAGAASLTIRVLLPGGNVDVAVDLSPDRFAGASFVRREYVTRAIIDDLRAAGVDGVVTVRPLTGIGLAGDGATTITLSGPVLGDLRLPAGPGEWLPGVPVAPVDLSAGPVLHVEVTPRVVVRFDGDPAAIADLTHARHADIRRAVTEACRIAGVPARADVPGADLRIAASPADAGPRHPVLGGAQLAELAAAPAAVPAADRPALFAVRAALGRDTLRAGTGNPLYLRVRNAGVVDSASTRLRLFRLDLAATPITATQVADAAPAVPAAGTLIQDFSWDPGGAGPRRELLLCVADEDRPERRIDVPASFAALEAVHAFATRRAVALRLFDVIGP